MVQILKHSRVPFLFMKAANNEFIAIDILMYLFLPVAIAIYCS